MIIEITYRIKQIREQRNLSLRDLASMSDLSHATISYIERGLRKPTIDVLIAIAEALNVEITELYTYRKL